MALMRNFQAYCVLSVFIANLMMSCASLLASGMKEQGVSEDYCQYEAFNARCLMNEVILVKSATYGRMSIGRCITAEEVAAHRSVAGDDPRYFGCSADVLPLLDRTCSGKAECEIRVIAMSLKNVTPCFPGLILYLEVSYTCISVLDEERSCAVTASTNPVHIMSTSASQRICGTKSNPWIINTSVGRRINISLLDFTHSNRDAQVKQRPCNVIGQVVDRVGNRNGSICVGSSTREKALFLSVGNTVNIFVNYSSELEKNKENSANENQFLLKIQALGCSDIVPPDDAWLKRDGDDVVIGCYSIRQNWHLKCKKDKWTGVLGNCSYGVEHQSKTETEAKPTTSSDEEVVAIVAIAGLTLAFCLAITCTGAVCLRRFYSKSKMKQEYNTLLSIRSQHVGQRMPSALCTNVVGNDVNQMTFQDGPTYSVFAEDLSESKDADNNSVIAYTGSQSCSAQV